MSDWDDAQREINSGTGSYYSPGKTLPVGTSEEIQIVGYTKWTETKYPIKDSAGNSLGYTWRFRLSDGRVWDVSNKNRKVLLAALHPSGQKDLSPCRFRVTNLGKVVNKQPSIRVEPLAVTEALSV